MAEHCADEADSEGSGGQSAAGDPWVVEESGVLAPESHVASTTFDDGSVVLFDARLQVGHDLSHSAAVLWRCLDGTASLGEIIDDICAAFEVDRSTASPDVLAAASRFVRIRVAEVLTQPPTGFIAADRHDGDRSVPGGSEGSPRPVPHFLGIPPST